MRPAPGSRPLASARESRPEARPPAPVPGPPRDRRREVEQESRAVGDQLRRVVGEPGPARAFRGLIQPLFCARPVVGIAQRQHQSHQEPIHRASSMKLANAAAGSEACSTGRPTTRWVAPLATASLAVATRTWSPGASVRRRIPGTMMRRLRSQPPPQERHLVGGADHALKPGFGCH